MNSPSPSPPDRAPAPPPLAPSIGAAGGLECDHREFIAMICVLDPLGVMVRWAVSPKTLWVQAEA